MARGNRPWLEFWLDAFRCGWTRWSFSAALRIWADWAFHQVPMREPLGHPWNRFRRMVFFPGGRREALGLGPLHVRHGAWGGDGLLSSLAVWLQFTGRRLLDGSQHGPIKRQFITEFRNASRSDQRPWAGFTFGGSRGTRDA
jgi:hypothetical protein